jgi:hypothetical protein
MTFCGYGIAQTLPIVPPLKVSVQAFGEDEDGDTWNVHVEARFYTTGGAWGNITLIRLPRAGERGVAIAIGAVEEVVLNQDDSVTLSGEARFGQLERHPYSLTIYPRVVDAIGAVEFTVEDSNDPPLFIELFRGRLDLPTH